MMRWWRCEWELEPAGLAAPGCGVGGKQENKYAHQSHMEGARFWWGKKEARILLGTSDNGWRYQSVDLDMRRGHQWGSHQDRGAI